MNRFGCRILPEQLTVVIKRGREVLSYGVTLKKNWAKVGNAIRRGCAVINVEVIDTVLNYLLTAQCNPIPPKI